MLKKFILVIFSLSLCLAASSLSLDFIKNKEAQAEKVRLKTNEIGTKKINLQNALNKESDPSRQAKLKGRIAKLENREDKLYKKQESINKQIINETQKIKQKLDEAKGKSKCLTVSCDDKSASANTSSSTNKLIQCQSTPVNIKFYKGELKGKQCSGDELKGLAINL
jgi:uncharacterized protein YlxW (UPF0749 family)